MKKTTVILVALVMLFVGAQKAQAVPMYYTFEGNVTSYTDTNGIIVATQMGAGFGVGSAVTYTFIVDFTADGYFTRNDGTVTTLIDSFSPPYPVDYFYADYYSGDSLQSINGGTHNNPGNVSEYNYGYDQVASVGNVGYLDGNSQNDRIIVSSYNDSFSVFDSFASSWTVGTSGLVGWDYAYDSWYISTINSSLTLTSITPVSVPEPSSLLLLGSGLFGFGLFRRKRKEG